MAAATVAAVCLGSAAAFTLGGDGADTGYVAVGPAGGPSGGPGHGTAPTGSVELVPLDGRASHGDGRDAGDDTSKDPRGTHGAPGPGASGDPSASGSGAARDPGTSPGSGSAGGSGGTGTGTGTGTPSSGGGGGQDGAGSPSGGSSPADPEDPEDPEDPSDPGPAVLKLSGDPKLADTDKRWCQDVTLTLRNSGGSAVRSGTVTFGTHVIGGLGIDWATVTTEEKLPVPIGAGEKKEKTWTLCVDSWRVPLGMHLETRDVTLKVKE
ncbi:hypothetical protein [Streptomyces sp. SID5785]|uniref:hypothetical protein n=1 Tax=Streptomyces sp. SID5785 TaxID=2690309 RepID=UPI0031BB3334